VIHLAAITDAPSSFKNQERVERVNCGGTAHVAGVSVQYVDTEIMNQLSYHVSSARFQSLGFTIRGDLERGIEGTLEIFRNVRAIA